jgi:transposase InsO family protein
MDETNKVLDLLSRINLFPGQKRLYDIAQKTNPEITKQQVAHYFNTDTTTQLTRVQKKQKATGHTVAYHLNELWQMDIFDLSKYQYFNEYNRYLLVAIDVFSRKAFAAPMKEKTPNDVKIAFDKLIQYVKPRSILSDHDSSFLSKEFTEHLDKLQIPLNVNAISDHHALGIIDNFAKRIKTILTAMFLKNKNTKWINEINRIISQYNSMSNGGLDGLSPNEACKKENWEKILDLNIDKEST